MPRGPREPGEKVLIIILKFWDRIELRQAKYFTLALYVIEYKLSCTRNAAWVTVEGDGVPSKRMKEMLKLPLTTLTF